MVTTPSSPHPHSLTHQPAFNHNLSSYLVVNSPVLGLRDGFCTLPISQVSSTTLLIRTICTSYTDKGENSRFQFNFCSLDVAPVQAHNLRTGKNRSIKM
ncbi:hypothetical protein Pcinc_041269 [Petrolisthes cinctipes]|uniref:Uncharacterized protein n=1 Tax=Petrolisthes cinctipes TaxID=88211 RepID=A0AAE1BNK4_PETCI|nr:hypothetical protein Pcinc_041269 [Petrolisthes cinctipes]